MELIPQSIQNVLPPLYATTDIKLGDKVVHAKLFTPWSSWIWYVIEFDPEHRVCWGLVVGITDEWGFFSLDELEAIEGPNGERLERDVHFTPKTIRKLIKNGSVYGD